MISASSPRRRGGASSCMPAARSRRPTWVRCSPGRCIPTRWACWPRSRGSTCCAARSGTPPTACRRFPAWCRRCSPCRTAAPSRRAATGPTISAAASGRSTNRSGRLIGPPAGTAMVSANQPVLEIRNLKKHFPVRKGVLRRTVGQVYAVDGISFAIGVGETLGLVGESGCGKTTAGRAVLRLLEPTSGSIEVGGTDIAHLSKSELRPSRRHMQIIFQDPFSSLNPRMTAGDIVGEPLLVHGVANRKERAEKVAALFARVGLRPAQMANYPHQFSGGQRQRIGIARALALGPKLIVGDQPVSELDVSIHAQVINLLHDLQSEGQLTYLFISHNLAVVEHISHHIAVMYLGRIVEYADTRSIFTRAQHPYTEALLSAVPVPDPAIRRQKRGLQGDGPSPVKPPSGCHFHTRCPYAIPRCKIESPPLREIAPGHHVSCHLRESVFQQGGTGRHGGMGLCHRARRLGGLRAGQPADRGSGRQGAAARCRCARQ